MSFQNSNPKILITQPYTPSLEASYEKIIAKYGADIHFQGFIEHESIPVPLFRKYKHDILNYTAVLFTNRTAIDSFFQLSKTCSIKIPANKKYFCLTEPLQNYLRKYIEFKKRKVFHGHRKVDDLFPLITKHKKESFLMPCSKGRQASIHLFFKKKGYLFKEIIIYKTKIAKLATLDTGVYDIIVFFSPIAVEAFASNFPNYQQGYTKIATFNDLTAKMVEKFGWENNIHAPTLAAPSIATALDAYFQEKVE
ncbi:MAG: uroporphyrinogen-III synthase [Bacteroidota bacterium]